MAFGFRLGLLCWVVMGAAACAPQPQESSTLEYPFELTIAHINDTHSAFDPVRASFQADDTQVYNEFGGHPRLHSRIEYYREHARTHNDSLLFLHGGDAWQGTAYFVLNEGRMNADILSQMGLDAMALGNHEFDLTNSHLNEFLDRVNFPVLAANIDASQDADLADQANLRPYVLYAFDGYEKTRLNALDDLPANQHVVGIFGLALEDMPNISPNTGDVQFFDMVSSAQRTVDLFHEHGVRNIIAVTHIGNALDLYVARRVNGIDLIVGGHSHTLLGDFRNLALGNNGEYAQQVTNPDGVSQTCVVQAGEYAQAMGRVRVQFNEQGRLLSCAGGNTLLSNDAFYHRAHRMPEVRFNDDETQQVLEFIEAQPNIAVVAEAQAMRAHIDTVYKPELEAAYGELLGFAPEQVMHVRRPGDDGSDKHGSHLAPILAQAQLQFARRDDVVQVTGRQPDFALINAGGIRTSLPEGELREGHISLEMLPFSASLSVVGLTGAQVRQLIQETVSSTLPEGAHAGRFPYGGGLRFVFTETAAYERGEVTVLEVNRGTLLAPDWQSLEDDRVYQVVINNYSATGNDGWTVLYDAQRETSDRVDVVLVDGKPRAFPVERVVRTGEGGLQVIYSERPDCAEEHVACNTDAVSVIEYFRTSDQGLLPLPYPVVTLERVHPIE